MTSPEPTRPEPTRPEPTITEPPRKSPWSLRARITRALWGVCEPVLWKLSPVPWHGFRCSLLRLFGAKVGRGVKIHPRVKVIIPWHIELADTVVVHEGAILYALGRIAIGEGSEVGPFCHICAGTHDYTDPGFTLLRQPITVKESCTLGAGSFLAPDVTLAPRTVLAPRAAVYADTEPGGLYLGNPAKIQSPEPATLAEGVA